MNFFWFVVGCLIIALIMFVASSCASRTTPDGPLWGYNPETMRCQQFDPNTQRFTGPFLPAEKCLGQPTPTVYLDQG